GQCGGHDGRARLARRHRHRDGAGHQAGRAPAAALAAGVSDGARVTRWTLALGAVLVLGAIVSVALARAQGWSGTRLSVLGSVVALWLTAYVLWGFAGGLAAHHGLIARYDGE